MTMANSMQLTTIQPSAWRTARPASGDGEAAGSSDVMQTGFHPRTAVRARSREPDPEDTGGIGYVGAVDNTLGNGVATLGHKRRQHVGGDCVQLVLIIGRRARTAFLPSHS